MTEPVTGHVGSQPITGPVCPKCLAVHNPVKCQGHVDPAKRKAYAEGGREARANAKGEWRQCQLSPLEGQDHCRSHGGAAPRSQQAAEQRVAEEKIRKTLGRLTSTPVTNPLEDLLALGGKAKAWMELLETHVAELERLRYSTEGGEHIRGEIVLFERAMESCRKVLVDVARLDIDSRLMRVTEGQIGMAMALADAVLRRRGIDPDSAEVRADKAAEITALVGAARTIEGVVA